MKKILLIIVLVISTSQLFASHLMGGQLTAKRIDSFKYEMLLTVYRDTDGIPIYSTDVFHYSIDSMGVWVSIANRTIAVDSGKYFINGTEEYHYIDTFTFPTSGKFLVTYSNCCRNAAIINMTTPSGESLFLQTILTIDSSGGNSTPEFLNPPVTVAQKNWPWYYNPLPYDADGDSIAWQLVTPLSSSGALVAGYVLPRANGLLPFTLDTITGAITWMPDTIGHFVASFLVSEFKNGIKIGEIRRDMQIIVIDDVTNTFRMSVNAAGAVTGSDGRLYIDIPVNQNLTISVTADDQNNDFLTLEAQGETFQIANPSSFNAISGNGSVNGTFSWTPNSLQVRERPYINAFRGIEKHGANELVHDQTILFRVIKANGTNTILSTENKFEVAFPNPTEQNQIFIPFTLASGAQVHVTIVNVLGQDVKTIFNNTLPAGKNIIMANNLPHQQGIYFIQTYINNVLMNTQKIIKE
ncbi:MAG: hypothetical protein RIQ33_1005 [Bacteroidota bacterium]